MDQGSRRRRRTLRDQWRVYGTRPPVARWTARVSLVLGATIGGAVLLTAAVLMLKALWLAVTWALFRA